MLGMMQSRPLLISSLLDYAASWHGQREIVSRDVEGSLHRTNWSGIADRAKRVASALNSLGVTSGERVATLAGTAIATWSFISGSPVPNECFIR